MSAARFRPLRKNKPALAPPLLIARQQRRPLAILADNPSARKLLVAQEARQADAQRDGEDTLQRQPGKVVRELAKSGGSPALALRSVACSDKHLAARGTRNREHGGGEAHDVVLIRR